MHTGNLWLMMDSPKRWDSTWFQQLPPIMWPHLSCSVTSLFYSCLQRPVITWLQFTTKAWFMTFLPKNGIYFRFLAKMPYNKQWVLLMTTPKNPSENQVNHMVIPFTTIMICCFIFSKILSLSGPFLNKRSAKKNNVLHFKVPCKKKHFDLHQTESKIVINLILFPGRTP